MNFRFHLLIYFLFVLYLIVNQLIIFGYEEINDRLVLRMDGLIKSCQEQGPPEPMPDLNERYYEN